MSAPALEAALGGGPLPDLAGMPPAELEDALRDLGRRHGAAAAPLLTRLAREAASKEARKSARRELYRLAQAGVALPEPAAAEGRPATGPLIRREPERATAAWLSGVDGAGSRAAWIVFEGGLGGGLRLCSLILNDEAGILESAGGPVTRKRLESELRALRESQKLPWVATAPERAAALVSEALALHASAGTAPPPEFARWRALFPPRPRPDPLLADARPPAPPSAWPDTQAADQAVALLELPELGGWFADPALIREDAVALLEMRDSRLVVSDQIKAEREAAIVDAAVAKAFPPAARERWARRLGEMALVFDATGRTAEA
ncbi:MAG TPA: hypothetical protein VJU81_06965, partial [Methylomirabilota bacterium]|nr:hypothetical protein [Methylomirabilota bacterium]